VDAPHPARGAPADRLLELVQMVRQELLLREESPTGPWVEESAEELRSGAKPGWYYPSEAATGLAFYNARGNEAFGHVHVGPGPDTVDRALALTTIMLDGLPPTVRSIDVGFTGLTTEDEHTLLPLLSGRPGSLLIQRESMDRALGAQDDVPLGTPPLGLEHVAVRDVTLDALADLDVRAFRGSTDELLIGHEAADYRRVLETLLANGVGRFVDEASTALIEPDPPRLIGALLTAERSPRRAVFLDFMVDPDRRGQGVGRYLLRWGFRALRALGYERVGLWVTVSNDSARHLYESLGFRRTATSIIYRWERTGPPPQPHAPR
jgi:ribosomal protein S18 acetylase RimI-like enzyme